MSRANTKRREDEMQRRMRLGREVNDESQRIRRGCLCSKLSTKFRFTMRRYVQMPWHEVMDIDPVSLTTMRPKTAPDRPTAHACSMPSPSLHWNLAVMRRLCWTDMFASQNRDV